MVMLDMYNGAISIAIEGGEGTGKGTLIKKLKKVYPDAVFAWEPGFGSKRALEIREDILKEERPENDMIHLFALARNEVKHGIPKGTKLVFTDRSIISSLVYQTTYHNDEDVLRENERVVNGFRLPDYVILLTGDVEKIQSRLHNSTRDTNWLDHKSLSYHKFVDRGYHHIIHKYYDDNSSLVLDNTNLEHSLNPSTIIDWVNFILNH